jgi:hypothetical protein
MDHNKMENIPPPPIIERNGLKYVWGTNAHKDCLEQVGSDVVYHFDTKGASPVTYKNAIIGPEDGRFGAGGVGIYKLIEPQP